MIFLLLSKHLYTRTILTEKKGLFFRYQSTQFEFSSKTYFL